MILLSIVSILQITNFLSGEKQQNFYDLMGVSPKGFTPGELKKSYYTLSK